MAPSPHHGLLSQGRQDRTGILAMPAGLPAEGRTEAGDEEKESGFWKAWLGLGQDV